MLITRLKKYVFKGGVKVITGKIAEINQEQYQVKTPIATIGIRGTAFSLDFSTAEAQLAGEVLAGEIQVLTEKGISKNIKEGDARPAFLTKGRDIRLLTSKELQILIPPCPSYRR